MISSQQLGERLGDARKARQLTQEQVAAHLGVARTTVVAMEKGKRRPTNVELVSLAQLLDVSVHDLLREHLVRGDVSPRFRMSHRRDAKAAQIVLAVDRLRRLGEQYAELEKMHGITRIPARLESVVSYRADVAGAGLEPRASGQEAALSVRSILGLGDEPVLDLDERFEIEAGLRIFYLDELPSDLAALFIWGDEIGACVGVNIHHPWERQRWSLVHEFAHFLRDREVGDVLGDEVSGTDPAEVFAEILTMEFLMPASGVSRRFADQCRLNGNRFSAIDIVALAQHFGVSFQAMTLRLEELQRLPKGTYEKLRASKIRPREIEERLGERRTRKARALLPARYVALAVAAYDLELIGEGDLARYLCTDRVAARGVYHEHQHIHLSDGQELVVSFDADDLRAS